LEEKEVEGERHEEEGGRPLRYRVCLPWRHSPVERLVCLRVLAGLHLNWEEQKTEKHNFWSWGWIEKLRK